MTAAPSPSPATGSGRSRSTSTSGPPNSVIWIARMPDTTSCPPVIESQIDAAEVGFDASRLARIDRHLDRYVEAGLLPRWQLVIAPRGGECPPPAPPGARARGAGLPVDPDTIWRIYSMTKPVVSVAAMTLWEEGAFELKDPIDRWLPRFADPGV